MSTDTRRRAAERAAKTDPTDALAVARAEAEHHRAGNPELAWVLGLVGDVVSIEGARINYLGKLVAVNVGPMGGISSLLIDGARSVWARAGQKPGADYVQEFGEMLVPWAYVHHLTRAPKAWR
jgi:hypothetical protein